MGQSIDEGGKIDVGKFVPNDAVELFGDPVDAFLDQVVTPLNVYSAVALATAL